MRSLKLIANNKGQGLVEYLLLTALIAVSAIGIVRLLSHSVNGKFAEITNSIQGVTGQKPQYERVEEKYYQKRDMSDFMRGSISREKSE